MSNKQEKPIATLSMAILANPFKQKQDVNLLQLRRTYFFLNLHELPLAGVLEDLTRNHASPRTYSGLCNVGESSIDVSEELNGSAPHHAGT